MSNNHHNSQCSFAEDLVSYLYGEINSAEKSKFENHLDKCSSCDEELAAFGYVRSSINDWRDEDFLVLETPEIAIPVFEKQQTIDNSIISSNSRLWFGGLRNLFSLSPAWATGTGAFAALAVFIGLTLVFINSSKNSDLTESKNPVNSTESIANTEKIAENNQIISENKEEIENKKDQPEPIFVEKNSPEKVEIPSKSENLSPEKAVVTVSEKITKTNRNTKNQKPSETSVAEKDRNNSNNKSNNSAVKNVPKLSNLAEEDENDDSLRLADLFDEVGSK